jgi:hypothetical protein
MNSRNERLILSELFRLKIVHSRSGFSNYLGDVLQKFITPLFVRRGKHHGENFCPGAAAHLGMEALATFNTVGT